MTTLDSIPKYVDTVAQGDVSIISLAGFTATRDQFQRVKPLDKIQYFLLKRTDVSGQIIIDIPAISNRGSVTYCCVCVEGAPLSNPNLVNGQIVLESGDPQIRQDFNKSRRKVFQGLTPGVLYYFYVFASNSVGVAPVSDFRSLWAA